MSFGFEVWHIKSQILSNIISLHTEMTGWLPLEHGILIYSHLSTHIIWPNAVSIHRCHFTGSWHLMWWKWPHNQDVQVVKPTEPSIMLDAKKKNWQVVERLLILYVSRMTFINLWKKKKHLLCLMPHSQHVCSWFIGLCYHLSVLFNCGSHWKTEQKVGLC